MLYRIAREVGATKIALGHHADDFIETLLLNLFFAGALKAMPAKLVSDDGAHVVIRPLVYVGEEEARAYTKEQELPIIGCCCPACGDLSLQRQRAKRLLMELEREHPGVKQSMLKALANVAPRHLLDTRLNPPAELVRRAGEPRTAPPLSRDPHDQGRRREPAVPGDRQSSASSASVAGEARIRFGPSAVPCRRRNEGRRPARLVGSREHRRPRGCEDRSWPAGVRRRGARRRAGGRPVHRAERFATCGSSRIRPTSERHVNVSVQDVGGAVLVVSQFTLAGDCRKGRGRRSTRPPRPRSRGRCTRMSSAICGRPA